MSAWATTRAMRTAARIGQGALPGLVGMLLLQTAVWAADPVAVITELRPGKGEIRLKRAGEADWIAPQPLLSLRSGDQLRATGDGRAVLAFTGGGAQTVSATNSPFTVQSPQVESGAGKARALLAGVTQFLLGQEKEPTYQSLSVRGLRAAPPRILSPRDTRLLPGAVMFEWVGPDALRYRVQLSGPQGVEWEQGSLARRPLAYPAGAPPLRAGTRYSWTLDAPGQPPQSANFEMLSEAEAGRVRAALSELAADAPSSYPPSTVILMRAGLFFQEGLYADARRELLAGIGADPDEPTLRLLLGHVYDRMGLAELAAAEFDEAQFLSSPRP